MKAILIAAGMLMLACSSTQAAETGWFTPQLIAGDPAECAPMLAGARELFSMPGEWDRSEEPLGKSIPGMYLIYTNHDGEPHPAATGTRQLVFEHQIGCGGACDTETAKVLSNGKEVFSTPDAKVWVEYSDGKGKDYLAGFIEDRFDVFAVSRSKEKSLACRIALDPVATEDDAVAMRKALDALNQASLGMSLAGGRECGSMATPFRWERGVEKALRRTLWRPWAIEPWKDQSDNTYRDYDRILPQLKQWSLGGFSEQAAFKLYKDRIAATEKLLAAFYVKRFGWQPPKAQSMAHAALTNAIATGFGFYMYEPFGSEEEERLRAALLGHAPMSEIQAIALDVKSLDPIFESNGDNLSKDSILNIAIAYPQALQYLLEKGFNPNRANPFGKTPLMYAAQYNQLEAARLLLKAGADPNARTTRPPYECGYQLSTTGMTPLHYAVRYSAAPLVQALLDRGAAPFIKAHKEEQDEKHDEAPIDWLHRYTSGEPGKEQNPNLTAQDAAALEKRLTVADRAMQAKIASAQVLLGEKEAAAGHDEAAYQAITIALQADTDNQKALADLPLLAFKSGRVGEAAAAAIRGITVLKSDAAKASAWFNLGLICQKQSELPHFDGEVYCSGDGIEPFLRAWTIAPSKSRAVKLAQVMEKDAIALKSNQGAGDRFCTMNGRNYQVMFGSFLPGPHMERIYVLHPAGETIDPKNIGWIMDNSAKPPIFQSPKLAGHHVLGDQALTVLESPNWNFPLMIDGKACGRE